MGITALSASAFHRCFGLYNPPRSSSPIQSGRMVAAIYFLFFFFSIHPAPNRIMFSIGAQMYKLKSWFNFCDMAGSICGQHPWSRIPCKVWLMVSWHLRVFFLFVVVVLSWWEPNDPRMIEVLRTFVESQPYPHDQIESKGTWTSTALNHVLELFSLRSQTEVLYEFLEYNINTSKHLQSLDNFIVSYIYCKLMNSPKISLY